MKNKLLAWLLLIVVLISLSSTIVFAPSQSSSEDQGVFGSLSNVMTSVLSFGALDFIFDSKDVRGNFFGFVRIAIAILIFAILYMGASLIPNMNKNIAITVAVILAIITAVFIPQDVLAVMGSTYAVLFSFIILGGPMLGIGALLFLTPTPGRFWAGIKLAGVFLLWWLISEIGNAASKIAVAAAL